MKPAWRISAVCLFAALLAGVPALAEHTRFWRTTDYTDFERGTADGIALWSDGRLVPAAKFESFADPNLAYLWSLRTDSKGRLYASGGSNAKVIRFDAQGHPTTVFESSELVAQAIALDRQDDLYVGTSPDGKVYKVTPSGQKSVFFDSKEKYIWSLAVGRDGTVYVGTGDMGKVFAVTPAGKSDLFYKSDERHIRAIALDGHGHLYLGTDPNGMVIRVDIHHAAAGALPSAGAAFVVYETAGQEVTSLSFDPKGNLDVAAIGAKLAATPSVVATEQGQTFVFSTESTVVSAAGASQQQGAAAPTQHAPTPAPTVIPFPSGPGGSHVYRIAPDGSPTLLWASPVDLVYSLGFSPSGKLLLGTGNSGNVIELEGDQIFSKVAETSSGQVTGFASGPGGRVYLCTANPGKVFTLGPGTAAEGTFTSSPFDAKIFSKWGRLDWWGEGASDGRVRFFVRSGNTSNPDQNWSKWYGPYTTPQAEPVGSPSARFVQWKVVFHPSATVIPTLSWVSLAYLPKNVPPVIEDVVVQDPGIRIRTIQIPQGSEDQSSRPVRLRMPHNGSPGGTSAVSFTGNAASATSHFEPPPQGFHEKGWQSIIWSAEDANGDRLEYSVYYRGQKEKRWKLLKKGLREPFYSWDTTTMPDGAYYVKVVASDAPSNPPAQALTDSRVSARFVVDNTPPAIGGLQARTASDDATITFTARDPASPLVRAEYSVDAGPWTLLLPVGDLSDAPVENYKLQLKGLSQGEHTISVRVSDLYENSGIAKITFDVAASPSAAR